MIWLTGLEPRRVSARHVKEGEIDLCNAASVLFEGGAIGTIHGAAAMPENNRALMRCVVTGSEGIVDRRCGPGLVRDPPARRPQPRLRHNAWTWVPESRRPTDALVDLALGHGVNCSPGESRCDGSILDRGDAARRNEARTRTSLRRPLDPRAAARQ